MRSSLPCSLFQVNALVCQQLVKVGAPREGPLAVVAFEQMWVGVLMGHPKLKWLIQKLAHNAHFWRHRL